MSKFTMAETSSGCFSLYRNGVMEFSMTPDDLLQLSECVQEALREQSRCEACNGTGFEGTRTMQDGSYEDVPCRKCWAAANGLSIHEPAMADAQCKCGMPALPICKFPFASNVPDSANCGNACEDGITCLHHEACHSLEAIAQSPKLQEQDK